MIQWVLRGGLATSALLIVTGLVVALVTGTPIGSPVRLGHVLSDSTIEDRIIALGLIALALTPFLRVTALIAIWSHQRDARFVALSVVVAAILIASIWSGW